ncbi:MAG: hypothetical protein ABI357_05875 [Granulicella sp.]
MDKANVAEWLLRRVVDPVRASELVGDQLEAHPAAGWWRFWVSMTRLLLIFSWRTLIGVAASPLVGLFVAFAFVFFGSSQTVGIVGLPATTVFRDRNYLLGISILFWVATAFSLVRLGWRSTLTVVGLIVSTLCSVSLSFFWQRTPAIVLTILWASFITFCVSRAKWRYALGILCGAVAVAWLTAFAISVFPPHDAYSIFGKWQGPAVLFLVPILESSATMLLHRKFIASQSTSL